MSTTPQHAIGAAKEIAIIAGSLRLAFEQDAAAIIAAHPDPELARLEHENSALITQADRLRAEVERLQKAGTSWEAIELRAEVEHLKKEVQENQLRFPCRMTKEAYLSDAKTRQDLRARVAELELQTFDIKKLEVDKARLDWLEEMHAGCNHGPMDKPTMFHCWVEVSGRHENPADHFYGNTLRAAIDLAKGGAQ